MTPVQNLHSALAAVCPIDTARIGRKDDRDTWSFDPLPEATEAQIHAAIEVLRTVDLVEPVATVNEAPPVRSEQLEIMERRLIESQNEIHELRANMAALMQSLQAASKI